MCCYGNCAENEKVTTGKKATVVHRARRILSTFVVSLLDCRYFYQSLNSLLTSSPSPFPIHIFNAAHPSSVHSDVTSLEQVSGIHVIHAEKWRTEESTAKIQSPIQHPWHSQSKQFGYTSTWKQKELVDYIDALEYCQNWLSQRKLDYTDSVKQYTLILEDDIVFTRNFFPKLETALHQLPNDATFLKLFVSDYWSGWESDDVWMIIAISIIGGSMLLLFLFCCDFSFRFLKQQYKQYHAVGTRKKEDIEMEEQVPETVIQIIPYSRKDPAQLAVEAEERAATLRTRSTDGLSFFPPIQSSAAFHLQSWTLLSICFLFFLFVALSLNKQNMFWMWEKDGIHKVEE